MSFQTYFNNLITKINNNFLHLKTQIDNITISQGANTDLSNLSSTGEAHFLKNIATGSNSLTIEGTATTVTAGTNIGVASTAEGTSATALGNTAKARSSYSIAIGRASTASANSAIQIGYGTNSTANTLSIGFYNNSTTHYKWELLEGATGLIPDARLSSNIARTSQIPDISTKQDTLVSGTNIKTINNTSILGSGNIDTSEIFVATYGTTTYQEVLDAYNAGKLICCNYNNLQLATFIGSPTGTYFLFSSVSNDDIFTYQLWNTDAWDRTIKELADTDLSNLSATGEAKFDAKVNKSGDTMTGELSIQADSAKIKLSNNYLTKGTNPDNTIFYSYQFNDSTNSDTWQNTRLGLLEESVQSNGTTSIALITYRNQAASTEGAALRLSMTSAGVASCTFPNTTCVDGQWIKASKQFFGGRTLSDSSSYLGLDLSDYLPNDGYSYELLLKGYVTTTNTSGAYIYLDIYSTLSDSQRVAEAQTRASATVEGGGSTLIPVSSDRILRVNRNTNFKGSATLYAVAYKRLGTNS